MTGDPFDKPDPRDRPADPAGTQPKVDPDSLLPAVRESLIASRADVSGDEEEVSGELLPERLGAAGAPALAGPPREAPHAARFQFLTGALISLGIAAIAGVVALAMSDGGTTSGGPSWSPWRPSEDAKAAPGEIAEHVGSEYHLGTGKQLVAVTGGGMEIAGLPLTIALRTAAEQGGDIKLIDGRGVLYRLCGLGQKCAIAEGKPSQQRHLLLRREALELALYTFRYVDDTDNVVVFMPPRLGQDPTQALFFRKADVDPELNRPLAATLTRTAPVPNAVRSAPDSGLVNRITTARLFQFSLTQGNQDTRAFLVLDPPGTPPPPTVPETATAPATTTTP